MPARNDRYLAALVTVAGALVSVPGAALAQNAVGNGRALEHQMQTRQPGAAPAINNRAFSQELMFRESIVSGTAPSGLAFRGDTDIPDRFEFRGELGEDDLFSYRRDSLYSGLSGRGIRGTEALQYQFALSVGGQVPATLTGPISYNRAGARERGADPINQLNRDFVHGQGLRRASPEDNELFVEAIETSSPLVAPLRSVGTFTANRSLQPTLVGLMQDRVTQQTSGQTASPLLGVQIVPLDTLRAPDLTPTLRNEPARPPNTNAFAPGPDASDVGEPGEVPTPAARGAYDQMMERFMASVTPEELAIDPPETELPNWAQDLMSLRNTLRGAPNPNYPDLAPQPTEDDEGQDRPINPLIDPEGDASEQTQFDLSVLRRLRDAGGYAETLIPVDLPRIDTYSAHMRAGEQRLAEGRFFDAEERFVSAMSSRGGDVNAQIGRAHAQIGAGLFLSAALNVRQLLVTHPEIAGMKFGGPLIPSAERLDEIRPMLRGTLDRPSGAPESGLLLAYLGYQLDRPDDIRDGLDALEAYGDESGVRLAAMLRGVWLDQPASEGE